jgi:hypothetical protein
MTAPDYQPAGERPKSAIMRLTKFPSALVGRPLRQRTSRPWLKYGLRALVVVLALLVVVVGAAVAVILSGPTEFAFIRDRVQAMLASSLGPNYRVDIGRAVVDVDPALGLVVEVDDVEIHDNANAIVARVPSTHLAIDPVALLRLKLEVSTIELSGAELSFTRSAEGEVYLGGATTAHAAATARADAAAPPSAGDGGFPELFSAIQIFDKGLEPSVTRAVQSGFLRFSLVDGTIDMWDAARQQQRRFPSTDVGVSLDPATSSLTVNLATSGYGGRWTATLNRDVDAATGERVVSAVFSQLTMADLFPKLGEETSSVSADIPLYGRGSIHFAADGTIAEANVRLDVGAGIIRFGDTRETMLLDEATVKLRWDLPNKVIVIDPSPIYFGDTRGVMTGSIRPDGDAGSRKYAFDVESRGAILAPRDSNEPPLVADRIAISGKVDLPANLITVDNAAIVTPAGSLAAAGTIGIGGVSPTVAIAASFSPMEVGALKQMWIPFIAPGARRWVLAHVISGKITAGQFDTAMPTALFLSKIREPVPEDQLRLDLRLEDVAFTTFGELPPILHANGNAVLAGSTFGVDVESAVVTVPSGASVDVTAGAFAVANTFQRGAEGQIELQLAGSASALGEIADSKPLRALGRRNILPSDLTGSAEASVSIRLPLKAGVTEAETDWKVTLNATDLSSSAPVEGRMFTNANVTIAVSPDDVTIKGKAKIDGVPADVSLSQPIAIGGQPAGPGARVARLTLDDAARKRLGIGLQEILGGTVGAAVSNIEDGSKGQHYELDLKRARLVMPGLGWAKAIGVPAQLTFDMKPAEGGGYDIENIALEGSGFGFTGTAKFDEKYGLMSADIDHFALHQGDSVAFQLTRTKTGYAITAKGASFDLKGVLDQVRNGGDPEGGAPDVTINARVDRLVGFNQVTIAGAKVSMATTTGYVQKLAIAGAIGGADMSVNYSDDADGATLLASSDDGGAVLRFIDLYSKVDGGRMSITGQRDGASGPLIGTFEIDDFNLINEQAMGNLVPGRNAPGGASGFDPRRIHFDRMIVKYRKLARTISLDEALLRGAAVGATFSGRFDLANSRMAINGTYLPAYNFNNAISRIPLIGLVLGGGIGGGAGLFGVTFRIEGALDAPRVFFNPLSAVAPGIFRKIFEFH